MAFKRILECVLILVLFAVTVAIFSIPVVIFYVYQDGTTENWREAISSLNSRLFRCHSDNNETLHPGNTTIHSGNSTSYSLPIAIDQPPLPNCVTYGKSQLCYKSLQHVLTESGQKDTTDVRVAPVNNQDLATLENNLQQMLSFISETCRVKGLPIYCQFLFPPCVENRPNQIFLTRSDCEALKRVYCHSEISLLKNFEGTELYNSYSYLNPNCNELPRASTPSLVSNLKNDTHSVAAFKNETWSNLSFVKQSITCNPEFVEVCSLCLPSCTTLYYNTRIGAGLQIDDVTKIAAASLCSFGATLFIILALIKWKDVFKFPTILVFYEDIIELTLGLLILIPFIVGRGLLFCSYPDMIRTLHYPPTPFCSISGFIFQFGVVAPFLLWLVHLGYITLLLSFPIFGEMKLKKWSKIIHAVSVPMAIIISLIAPIVIQFTVGYVTFAFPPPVCFPASMEAVFYSVALVDCIILCCGVILMIVTIRQIHKSLHSPANEARDELIGKKSFFSAPELKMIVLSVVFVVLGILVLAILTHNIATQGEYAKNIKDYAKCQLFGDNPDCKGRREDIRIVSATLSALAAIGVGLTPYVNIFFILKKSDLTQARDFIKSSFRKIFPKNEALNHKNVC